MAKCCLHLGEIRHKEIGLKKMITLLMCVACFDNVEKIKVSTKSVPHPSVTLNTATITIVYLIII